MFAAAAPPKSRLGRYRLLAPTAGVKVSPLCLGAMNFGTGWYVANSSMNAWPNIC